MRRSRCILLLAVAAALVLGALAGPVSAAQRGPTGERIGLHAADGDYPERTPFFIRHGFSSTTDEDQAIGRNLFTLEVDGTQVAPSYIERSEDDGIVTQAWVFNFPNGMTGEHTFIGHWYLPCGAATAYLDCDGRTPNTPVESDSAQVTVTFK